MWLNIHAYVWRVIASYGFRLVLKNKYMTGHVEGRLIRINKDNLRKEGSACELSFVHVQSKAYYFGDVARLDMWCTCMIGGHGNTQPGSRWCVR